MFVHGTSSPVKIWSGGAVVDGQWDRPARSPSGNRPPRSKTTSPQRVSICLQIALTTSSATATLKRAEQRHGNTGAGGTLTDTDNVTINVNTLINGTPGDDSYIALPGQEMINGFGGIDSVTFNFKLVEATVGYEANKVIIDGPAAAIRFSPVSRCSTSPTAL